MMGTAPSLLATNGEVSRYGIFGPLGRQDSSPAAEVFSPPKSGGNSHENMVVVPWFELTGKADGDKGENSSSGKGENSSSGSKRRNSSREKGDDSGAHPLPPPAPLRRKLDDDHEAVSNVGRKDYYPSVLTERTVDSTVQRIVGNKYELKDLIGEGTFSKVYRGWERGSNCVYALKVVNKRHRKLQSSGNLYEKEIRILQNCKPHPNIIRLHEVLRGETHVCMVMELAVGGDLLSRLKSEGHFSEEQSMLTVKMILTGVMHLHNNGITHRDLKLENILYKTDTPDSVIVISDFGLAYQRKVSNIEFSGCNCKNSSNCGSCSCNFFAMSGDCGMSTTCGTAEYFSPEMLDGEIYTGKVDLWAVGVVTYAMLCGKMPFSNEDGGGMGRVRMYQRIKMADYSLEDEIWSEVSETAKHFLSLLLCVDVDKRLDAHAALHHLWLTS